MKKSFSIGLFLLTAFCGLIQHTVGSIFIQWKHFLIDTTKVNHLVNPKELLIGKTSDMIKIRAIEVVTVSKREVYKKELLKRYSISVPLK